MTCISTTYLFEVGYEKELLPFCRNKSILYILHEIFGSVIWVIRIVVCVISAQYESPTIHVFVFIFCQSLILKFLSRFYLYYFLCRLLPAPKPLNYVM